MSRTPSLQKEYTKLYSATQPPENGQQRNHRRGYNHLKNMGGTMRSVSEPLQTEAAR